MVSKCWFVCPYQNYMYLGTKSKSRTLNKKKYFVQGYKCTLLNELGLFPYFSFDRDTGGSHPIIKKYYANSDNGN